MSPDDAPRDAIIVDANVLVGAAIGRSFSVIADLAHRAMIRVPTPQIAEARRVLETHGAEALAALDAILDIVDPVDLAFIFPMEARARERLHGRAQPDWPVLAAALALDADIWSRDRDFFGVGVPVWETRNIRYAARSAAEVEQDA